MATPEINENCRYVQKYPHKSKIKREKFHFDILCHYGVIKESLPGGQNPPSPRLKLGRCVSYATQALNEVTQFFNELLFEISVLIR